MQTIRSHRRNPAIALIAKASTKFLRAYFNENFYDFHRNGENFALQTFAKWANGRHLKIWDVGANSGDWATIARRVFPGSSIQSFEIIPSVADEFQTEHANDPAIKLHRCGLSDENGTVDVSYNVEQNLTSSISYRNTDRFGTQIKVVTCDVKTADTVIASGVDAPEFLKIDTEGHDFAVLRGARDLLSSDSAPTMIQFEYGETWIPACETLEGCHRFLTEAGYEVGRLYPDYVDFKAYDYSDDHFRMGNMIAVKNHELRQLLAGQ